MKKLLLTLLAFIVFVPVFAQSSDIDELDAFLDDLLEDEDNTIEKPMKPAYVRTCEYSDSEQEVLEMMK